MATTKAATKSNLMGEKSTRDGESDSICQM